jgi:tol-pal system beta propeller repeat protein TolB
MDTLKKYLPLVDRFLVTGLGCGLIGLCILTCGFLYAYRNPPRPRPSSTPIGLGVPATATSDSVTPTISVLTSTPFPTLTATPQGAPAIVPTFGGDFAGTPPAGKIVFTCYVEQIDQICLMNADGSGRKQLTHLDATSFYASLSPDGQMIYFTSRHYGSFDIYSMNIKGKELKKLTHGLGALYAPELSPNGKQIVFTKNGDGIWVMRADGKNPHRLTNQDDIDPTWSPDGSMISFASSRTGQRQLYIMDADGSNIRQITDLNDMGGRSTWSPDGKFIAFYRGPAGDHNVFVVEVATKATTRLTSGGDNLGPSWSPDGNWIAFTSFRDGNNEIYIMHPDGTGVTRLTSSNISDWQPRWGK